jgi:hypothetical protein
MYFRENDQIIESYDGSDQEQCGGSVPLWVIIILVLLLLTALFMIFFYGGKGKRKGSK